LSGESVKQEEIAEVDWIRVTGRWQLSSKTPQRGKNTAIGKHTSAKGRDVSERAVAEERKKIGEVKKPIGR
jgi:hypothetical protein